METKTPEEIAKAIFYSPATNGKAEENIKKGAELIERYSQSLSTEIERLRLMLSGKTFSCPVCDSMAERNRELGEMLIDAKLQIDYLHGKFQETGTGNSVISRIEQLLSNQNNKK